MNLKSTMLATVTTVVSAGDSSLFELVEVKGPWLHPHTERTDGTGVWISWKSQDLDQLPISGQETKVCEISQ